MYYLELRGPKDTKWRLATGINLNNWIQGDGCDEEKYNIVNTWGNQYPYRSLVEFMKVGGRLIAARSFRLISESDWEPLEKRRHAARSAADTLVAMYRKYDLAKLINLERD